MNKAAKIGMIVWTILCFLGACSGMINVARNTQGRDLGDAEAAGVGVGLFIWLVVWAIPMVVMGIVALVTRSKSPAGVLHSSGTPTLCQHCGKYYEGAAKYCPLCGKAQNAGSSAAAGS